MHFFARHRENIRQSSMSSRLLWPCLLLAALLLLTFGAALFLFASLHNTKKDTTRSLEIQYSVFQNDMERYFDQLAVMGVNLSEDMSAEVDKELALRQMSFAQLNDSPEVLNALEEKMIEPLCRRLRQTGCSGAFVLLDAAVFLRWLTEQQRNLEFAADTGYMPVSSAAFDAIADYPFEQQSYQRLYDVYNEMRIQNTPLSEPGIAGYHAKAKTLYDSLRQRQKDYPQRLANGETLEALTEETWQLLCDNA